jgi:hypothetical protein
MAVLKTCWVRAGLVLSVLMASACVPTFDDNLSLVEQPRLLAAQAEPAEAAPGSEVALTGLVASGDVNGAPPELSWGLCIARKPLTELGPVNPICIQAPELGPGSIIPLGSGTTVKATLPMDACRLFGPSLPEPMNGEPPGRPVDPDPTGGYYQPVGVTLRETGVTSLAAVRIFCPPSGLDQEQAGNFNANYRLNQNPSFESVALLDGGNVQLVPDDSTVLSVARSQPVHFRASWATCPNSVVCGDGVCGAGEDKNNCAPDCATQHGCTGAESYALFNADSRQLEARHESIRVSWYASAGHFEQAITGRDESEFESSSTDDTWTAPALAGNVRFWLVIRDARGGQSFRSFVLSVAP